MVLLSITPLLDGVLRRDIIAPFHTSGPPLLQFHLAIEQWGFDSGTTEKNIVILPLPVINPLAGFACLTDSNGTGDIGIKSMSSTSIVVDVDTNKAASRNFYWLVIAL